MILILEHLLSPCEPIDKLEERLRSEQNLRRAIASLLLLLETNLSQEKYGLAESAIGFRPQPNNDIVSNAWRLITAVSRTLIPPPPLPLPLPRRHRGGNYRALKYVQPCARVSFVKAGVRPFGVGLARFALGWRMAAAAAAAVGASASRSPFPVAGYTRAHSIVKARRWLREGRK